MCVYKNCTKNGKRGNCRAYLYYRLKMHEHSEALLFINRIGHHYIRSFLKYEHSVFSSKSCFSLSLLLESEFFINMKRFGRQEPSINRKTIGDLRDHIVHLILHHNHLLHLERDQQERDAGTWR